MPIVWTDRARQALPASAREKAPAFEPAKPEAIWAALRRALAPRGKYDPLQIAFVKGRGLTTPELAALMEKCEAIASVDAPPALDDRDVAAALAALAAKLVYGQATSLLLAILPVPRAFAALLRARDFAVVPRFANLNDPYRLVAAAPEADVVDADWRAILLAQPDEIRAECKEIARAFLPRANLGQRLTLAHAFFEESEWGDAVCRDWIARGVRPSPYLVAVVHDFELVRPLLLGKDGTYAFSSVLVDRFGERMLPVLIELAGKGGPAARSASLALALFDDPAAANVMATFLGLSTTRPTALEYFGRFPHHAEPALAALSNAKGRTAKIAREVLTGAARAATAATPEDEAPESELPRVLATPPWTEEKRPRKPSTKLTLEPIELPETVAWPPGVRERAQKLFPRPAKAASPETVAEYRRMRESGRNVAFVSIRGEAVPDEMILEAWNAGQKTFGGSLAQKLEHVLAIFGAAAFPGLPHFVEHLAHGWGDAPLLPYVRSHRLALPMAARLGDRKIAQIAWQWLSRNAELAVLALVPVAFGGDKSARGHAERALFRLRASGVDVVGIGARYGAPARAALEKLLAWDPLYDLPRAIPKLPPTFRPETLTRPRLASGKSVPASALGALATMLMLSPLDPPYAGLVAVKEACDARSLAEFSYELARSWELSGHKKKDRWMLMSLVHFADDEVVRRLTPGMRPDFAVTVLEAIGSDAALMEMATIAGRTQTAATEWTIGGRIEKLLEQAAAERGVTKDELEEDLAPTAELDDAGALVLDYGSRKLEVGFDECLVPFVRSESGARARALPPARKSDDPAKVERAKSIWRDLKEDVTVIAARRIRALERAMTSGRTWTIDRFGRVWLEHRLMKHLARGVIWTDGTAAFRIAEDGTLSNADDAPHALAPGAKIGVAHPLAMSKDELAKWRTILDDYEIAQPFAQIGREYVAIDEAATRVPWPYGNVTAADLVARVSQRGFRRLGYTQGKQSFRRDLSRGGALVVEFKATKTAAEETALVFFDGDQEVPLSRLDPREIADAVYDLRG